MQYAIYLAQVCYQQPAASRDTDHGQVGRLWESFPHSLDLSRCVARLPHHVKARRGEVQARVASPEMKLFAG